MGPAWTANSVLPGGEGPPPDLKRLYPFLDETTAARLAESYCTEACRILGDAKCPEDLGRDFGHGFSEAELRWMIEREWARTADDVLWRRSKLGLYMSGPEVRELTKFLDRMLGDRRLSAPTATATGRTP
jgi:glycerol-3-phosphate dehydrogenase